MGRYRPRRGNEGAQNLGQQHHGGGGHGQGGNPGQGVPGPGGQGGQGSGSGGGGQGGGQGGGAGGGGGGGGGGSGGGGSGGGPYAPTADFDFNAGLENYLSGLQAEGDVATSNANVQTGAMFNRYFDPNNPFSHQALLQRELHQSHAENALNAGAAGHLYGGQLEARQADTAFSGAQGEDQMLRDYLQRFGDIQGELQGTLGGLQSDAGGAYFDLAQAMAEDISDTDNVYRRRRRRRGQGGQGGGHGGAGQGGGGGHGGGGGGHGGGHH